MRITGQIQIQADPPGAAGNRRDLSLDGLDPTELPAALARVQATTEAGTTINLQVGCLDSAGHETFWPSDLPPLRRIVEGAGFDVSADQHANQVGTISASRLRSLPDHLARDMRVLVCGLNPSLHSADLGVGFGRNGNRFWPAALAAGLVSVDRDALDAVESHGVGMTDLVKRATPRAASIEADEYADGVDRLTGICTWLKPRIVCMVGMAGWRAAVDRKAIAGLQERRLGSVGVYVMPSTSGLNAHSSLADLTDHLRIAAQLADSDFI